MIEENAVVVAIDGDWVLLETQRKSVCGQCSANKGCGTATLQKVMGKRRNQIQVLKPFPVRVGDDVVIGIDENALLKGSFMVYVIPLVLLILFGALGEIVGRQVLLSNPDILTILFAGLGLFFGLIWLKTLTSRLHYKEQYQPKLLRLSRSVAVS